MLTFDRYVRYRRTYLDAALRDTWREEAVRITFGAFAGGSACEYRTKT
jgi:hypothetical protein